MPVTLAFFRRTPEGFEPLDLAASLWKPTQMHGVATSGLLARALEEAVDRPGWVPARYQADLFRAASTTSLTTVRTALVREGSRIAVVDAWMEQEGETMARARATFLRPTATPAGQVWSAPDRAVPPPADVAPETEEPHIPFFCSDAAWSDDFSAHQNAGRHATWQVGLRVIEDEKPTPFQVVASTADSTSMVCNWGSAGVEYINTDIDLAICRLPVSTEIGLRALDHVAADGVAVGTAEVFDRLGSLGTATVTALANTRRTVDFGTYDAEGTRAANV